MVCLQNRKKDFLEILEQYKFTKDFDSSRIRQDLTKEFSTSKDYKGREIYELIQNAEDEESDFVRIELNTNEQLLIISNGGGNCSSFSMSGFSSIMMAEMSPKEKSKGRYIGYKGLGFRSLINWAEGIQIISSGVKCSFSRKIAKDYWLQIAEALRVAGPKKGFDAEQVIEKHEKFARRNFNLDSPVAMLSIPKVEDCVDHKYTTQIRVMYKDGNEDSILEQLQLLSGKVLLFLEHLKRIELCIDGVEKRIEKQNCDQESDELKRITLLEQGEKQNLQHWLLLKDEGEKEQLDHHPDLLQKYEVAVAYCLEKQNTVDYVYSFFPTRVRLHLPCVVHATFELDSSRNAIIGTPGNLWIQEKLAETLLTFAVLLAKREATPSWSYFDLLRLKEENDIHELPRLHDILEKQRETMAVYPTLQAGYQKLKDTMSYSEVWAEYLQSDFPKGHKEMKQHLIPGFVERGLPENQGDQVLHSFAFQLSKDFSAEVNEKERINLRARMIVALNSIDNHSYSCIPVLEDENGALIEGNAKIFVGNIISNLPKELNIRYVSGTLVKALTEEFGVRVKKDRDITALLRENHTTDVSDMDVSALKTTIVNFLKKYPSKEDSGLIVYRQLIYALYRYYWDVELSDSENHSNIKNLFKDPGFRLLSASKKLHFPSELILNDSINVGDCWKLLGTVDQWSNWFSKLSGKKETQEQVIQFFTDYIGVSRNFSMYYIGLNNYQYGKRPNFTSEYLLEALQSTRNINEWEYCSRNIEEKRKSDEKFNRFFVIDETYLNELVNLEGFSLVEVLRLMLKDQKVMRGLKKNMITRQYRTQQDEPVSVSYPLFCLRKYALFNDLKSYIVADHFNLLPNKALEKELELFVDEPDAKWLLTNLGAKENLFEVSLNELYSILNDLPKKKLKSGVQRIYKSIREAINHQLKEKNTALENYPQFLSLQQGYLYARKNGGELEIRPTEEVYYWDNDQLPKRILREKYKLEIGNRVGEDNVRKIFGVKLAKDILLKMTESTDNCSLTMDFQKHYLSRIRYILAYRLHHSRDISDSTLKDYAQDLKNIQIEFHSQCKYLNEGIAVDLLEGEMITVKEEGKTVFHICCSIPYIQDALRIPSFCENITEAICIVMKVTSNDMANSVRSVLKNSEEENSYIGNKEISTDEWVQVNRAVGLGQNEQNFWKAVERETGVAIDLQRLTFTTSEKWKYLQECFPSQQLPQLSKEVCDCSPEVQYELLLALGISNAGILGEDGLSRYYEKWLDDRCYHCKDLFFPYAYKQALHKRAILPDQDGTADSPTLYYDYYNDFIGQKWIRPILNNVVYTEKKLIDFFEEDFQQRYHVDLSVLASQLQDGSLSKVPEVRPEYEHLLHSFHLDLSHLDRKDQLMTLFEGYEEIFKKLLQSKYLQEDGITELTSSMSNPEEDLPIAYFQAKGDRFRPLEKGGYTPPKKIEKGYGIGSKKNVIGRNAEKAVLTAMLNCPDRYSEVQGCSLNLDPSGGNDSLHYDITYKRIVDGVTEETLRYLEVKATGSNSILMSALEYDFAMSHRECYDFALVTHGKICFIESPFVGGLVLPQAETYRLTMKLEEL